MTRYLVSEGTAGARAFEYAAEIPGEPVFIKQTFDGFLNEELQEWLKSKGKRFLLMGGAGNVSLRLANSRGRGAAWLPRQRCRRLLCRPG